MHILTLSGSLRAGSSNTAVLDAVTLLAPASIRITRYDGIGGLPHFNPDWDDDRLPPVVAAFRAAVCAAGGLFICSPEYAHGVPGSFKNALDWLVGCPDFPGKPVALITVSAHATFAQAALREILTTMSARIIDDASITILLPSRRIDARTIAEDVDLAGRLRAAIDAFVRGV